MFEFGAYLSRCFNFQKDAWLGIGVVGIVSKTPVDDTRLEEHETRTGNH